MEFGFDSIYDPFRAMSGGSGGGSNESGSGCGTAGSNTTIGNAVIVGVLGGSGGVCATAAGGKSGTPSLGGGSGGGCNTATGTGVSGPGGKGLVVIERIG
jgi:hypothetical protein